jgi:hypothetical protein
VAYSKTWDPDGRGVRKIADKGIAEAIIQKAKKLHKTVGVAIAISTAFFCFFP